MTDTIFLIVGESGSGKDTIVNRLVKLYGVRCIDSYTTRPRRDINDRHLFVDNYFEWKANNPDDTIVGYTLFDGHHYWATASQVEENNVYIIDPDGVRFFRNAYCGPKDVKVIYFNVPAYKRIFRMLKRGDGIIKSLKRFFNDDAKFFGAMQMADYVISDAPIENMVNELWAYMNKEG